MNQQSGGTFLGFIIGVVIGLAAALAVAVYVTKVPVPFVNKDPPRNAEQDAAELQKNKNWDPNAPLYGKNPAKPMPSASAPAAPAESSVAADPSAVADPAIVPAPTIAAEPAPAARTTPTVTNAPAVAAHPAVAPAPTRAATSKADAKPSIAADPLGDLARARAANVTAEPFTYFVQVGAFRTAEDAQSQRAKLSLSGVEAKISEREQAGRTVFRVRVGPFDKKDDAERTKSKLDDAGMETAMVRVQR